ncbi:MAG: glycosyltransferase [Rikenellaceae bacterium]
MIPKKIHFCWLSGDEYPPLIEKCLETWQRVLPDYEIILWDTKRFDINSVDWVRGAFEAKKYAFAADYIRFYALYTEGGIYLDSDVEVLKSFDPLLDAKSFMGYEAATRLFEPAIVGAEANTEWCGKMLDFYKDRQFVCDVLSKVVIAPRAVERVFNDLYSDLPKAMPTTKVTIGGGELVLYPAEYFSPIKYDLDKSYNEVKKINQALYKNPNTYCIHRFNGSWTEGGPPRWMQIVDMVKKWLYGIFGKRRVETTLNLLRAMMGKSKMRIRE